MQEYFSHRLARIDPCNLWLKLFPPSTLSYDAPFACLFGCGVIRRYGFGALQPAGNFSFAASSDNDGTMITSSPSFQLTGVATLYFDVNCNESITRKISSKLRPQLAG